MKKSTLRVLGVDPGTLNTGWGIVEGSGHEIAYVTSDVIRVSNLYPMHERLWMIFQELRSIPVLVDVIAVEATFVNPRNPKSALAIAQARAVVGMTAARAGLRYVEYSPAAVKRAVVSNGRAGKDAVRLAVEAILQVPGSLGYDEADALAVAICHFNNEQQNALLARSGIERG